MVAAGEGLRVGTAEGGRELRQGHHDRLRRPDEPAGGRQARRPPTPVDVARSGHRQAQAPSCSTCCPSWARTSWSRSAYNSGSILVTGPTRRSPRSGASPWPRDAIRSWDDERDARRVAFLGSDAAKQLFGTREVVGETIRIGNFPYAVIGVDAEQGAGLELRRTGHLEGLHTVLGALRDMPNRPPWRPDSVDRLLVTPESVPPRRCKAELRRSLGLVHDFDPRDEEAAHIWDTAEEAKAFRTMTDGMKYFLGAVGIATLFIGGYRRDERDAGRASASARGRLACARPSERRVAPSCGSSSSRRLDRGGPQWGRGPRYRVQHVCARESASDAASSSRGCCRPGRRPCSRSRCSVGGASVRDLPGAAGSVGGSHRGSALRGRRVGHASRGPDPELAESRANPHAQRSHDARHRLGNRGRDGAARPTARGFREVLVHSFDSFGRSAVVIWPGQTSEQAGGERAGPADSPREGRSGPDPGRGDARQGRQPARPSSGPTSPTATGWRIRPSAASIPSMASIRNEVPSEGRWLSAEDFVERVGWSSSGPSCARSCSPVVRPSARRFASRACGSSSWGPWIASSR